MRLFFSSVYYDGEMYVKRGTPVANLVTSGHRISEVFGVRNVSRYTGTSIISPEMLRSVIEDLRSAGGSTLFIVGPSQQEADVLLDAGFVPLTRHGWLRPGDRRISLATVGWGNARISKWRDTFNPAPPYLAHERGRPVPLGLR
jgi:hypothetical protein